MQNSTFLIPVKAPYNNLVFSALAGTAFLFVDLTTDFSCMVYTSRFFDLDTIKELQENLKKSNNSDYQATVEELVLIYSCHYIANLFAADKSVFFKWYLEFEKGDIANSEDFRKVAVNSQKGACMILENRYGSNRFLMERKKNLELIFGILAEEK
ncbi:MAG: hypothetical protein ABI855_19200 [Bacteroidota bacterium]